MGLSKELIEKIKTFQENEITEYHIYRQLAKSEKSEKNSKILREIAEDELGHYNDWKEYSKTDVKPNRIKIWFFYWISKLFGITFGIKLMERGEESAQDNYAQFSGKIDKVDSIIEDENDHENKIIELLDERHLKYVGSIVLGLNDALVELTGALAGLTLALQRTQLIALSGLITGIAAALSMGASEYLSTKEEETARHPVRASIYTGGAYIITVFILILPYLLFTNYYFCLALTLLFAVAIIAFFNYYISVVKDESFKGRFLEMTIVSLGVAIISFGIGYLIRHFMGVEL
jgi:VIT1/CCC1 family predicted Fe2+/Mn2+ transporter